MWTQCRVVRISFLSLPTLNLTIFCIDFFFMIFVFLFFGWIVMEICKTFTSVGRNSLKKGFFFCCCCYYPHRSSRPFCSIGVRTHKLKVGWGSLLSEQPWMELLVRIFLFYGFRLFFFSQTVNIYLEHS